MERSEIDDVLWEKGRHGQNRRNVAILRFFFIPQKNCDRFCDLASFGPAISKIDGNFRQNTYHIRINKRRVALKKQIYSEPHENEENFNRRKTALIAPRLAWEQ